MYACIKPIYFMHVPFISEVEKKGIGTILGIVMAIGDAMGARYEFEDFRY